ncbi:acetoacetyl-CoA synthetase [Crepidotus variabilis]|uniref:Acetoacetyl-CoA synthetase n=1 Tax=Crepidotus variabilis TaxID=179855 RepID=A0A9P6EI31_9AGAR|nr:acetoacetyl-CoA synthetase [Crepidotus variabilis]
MTSSYFAQSKLLWAPPDVRTVFADSLRRDINRKRGLNMQNYRDLHAFSVSDYAFWLDLWEAVGVISSVPPQKDRIIIPGKLPEVPTWFPDARLNFAENILQYQHDGIALSESTETGVVTDISFRQLRERVRVMAAAMRANGLKVGDRVAAVVTNSSNAIIIALAAISIGAVYSSTSTDMGLAGILDRYTQIRPKFIFAETEYVYGGKIIDLRPKMADVVKALSAAGLQQAILLPSRRSHSELLLPDMSKSTTLSTFLNAGGNGPLVFEQLPFNHPCFIVYSSGTTGKPKCIIHCAGGVLLTTLKDQKVLYDFRQNDCFFQYTTTGWIMWNAMVVALAMGVRLVIYDGSPFHPDPRTYLKFVGDQGITTWGMSPRWLAEIQGRGIWPLEIAPFDSLRTVMVTGAIFTAPLFEYAMQAFGRNIHLASASGGTDICGSFVTGTPCLPVYAGEIQTKSLGVKVEVFDPDGRNIEHTGEPGELVCTRPHPSVPIGLWGDESGKKLRETYFSTFPGIWRQGDFMVVNPATKGIQILGRSDGVLNPSGVRFGSGEIYAVLEKFADKLDDSLCVGQRRSKDKDERVLLFLKLRPGIQFTSALESKIKNSIKVALSARHVPAYIFEVPDIPYTVNGKKIEIAIKQIVSGSSLTPSGTVANPDSLKFYYQFRDIENIVGSTKSKL